MRTLSSGTINGWDKPLELLSGKQLAGMETKCGIWESDSQEIKLSDDEEKSLQFLRKIYILNRYFCLFLRNKI